MNNLVLYRIVSGAVINVEGNSVVLSGVIDNRDKFLNANRIVIVACGTSWHAALIGEHLIEDLCRIPVEVEYASEFRYRNPVIHPGEYRDRHIPVGEKRPIPWLR